MARPLTARFAADTSSFTSAVKEARRVSVAELKLVAGQAVATAKAFEHSGRVVGTAAGALRLVGGFQAALLAASAFSAALVIAQDRISELVKIAEGADRVGLGTSMFQAMTSQARGLKVEVDDLTSAMRAFRSATTERFEQPNALRQRIDEFALAGFDLGPNARGREDFANATNQDDRLRAVLRTMGELEQAGQRLAALDIAERAFGNGRLVERLREGKVTMAEFARDVERTLSTGVDAGSIVPPDVITRATELNDRLAEAGRTIASGLKPVWDDVARIAVELYASTVAWTEALGAAARAAGTIYTTLRDAAAILPRLAAERAGPTRQLVLEQEISGLQTRIRREANTGPDGRARALALTEQLMAKERELFTARGRGMGDAFNVPTETRNPGPAVATPPAMPLQVMDQRNAHVASAPPRGRGGGASTTRMTPEERVFRELADGVQLARAGLEGLSAETVRYARAARLSASDTEAFIAAVTSGKIDEAPEKLRRIYESVRQIREGALAADLRFESEQLGRTEPDQRIASRLRSAGLPVDLESTHAQIMRLNDALSTARGLSTDFMQGFVADVRSGMKPLEALAAGLERIAARLADMALQRTVEELFAGFSGARGNSGAGQGGGLFSGIFSAIGKALGFAEGGVVRAATGGRIAGPGGPRTDSIPAMLSNGEFVVNAAATGQYLPLLEAINSGRVAMLESGGRVGAAVIRDARAGGATVPAMNVTFSPIINNADPTTEARILMQMEAQRRGFLEDLRDMQVRGAA